uniref:BTB domain-containing protein n=1 Tax=Panagrolaimus sp. ES5 TaxID=591445 RepID=A0AC34G126_9BILA
MSIASAFEILFDSKEDADCTFIIHNSKELPTHQLILVHQSPVFKAMIKGPMAPKNQRHEITDPQVTFDDFNNFLKFLYTEKCDVNVENIEVLLHFSDMYDVSSLAEFSVNTLVKTLSANDLLQFAEFGILNVKNCDIVLKCLTEISKVQKPFSLQYQKENEKIWISPELVLEFAKRCPRTHYITENKIFEKVLEWANGQCEKRNIVAKAKNLKEIMAPFVSYFKLKNMDIGYLTSTVYEYELIPEKRLLKYFRDYIKIYNISASLGYCPTSPPYAPASPTYAPCSPTYSPMSPSFSPC